MSKRLKRLQDQKAALAAEMRAMIEAADKEERSLGAGEGHEKEKDNYAKLEKRFDDVCDELKIEERLQERERNLAAVPDHNQPTEDEKRDLEGGGKPKPIPASALQRYGTLKAFKGDKANERAYRAGQWFMAALFGNQRAAQFCQDNGIELRAQAEGINTAGGYLVPNELLQVIIDLREKYGVFRNECRVVPMTSDSLTIPRRAGGVTAYFVGENDEITESDKEWDGVALVARKLGAMVRYSSEISEDAIIDIADDLASEIAYAFALKEDQCGFNGDGTSTYGKITGATVKIDDGTHTASVVTAATGNTAFSTLDLVDFNKVVGALPEYAAMNAKWYISKAGFANSMQALMYAAGGNTTENVAGQTQMTFLGYPVVISQVLNKTLTAQTDTIKCLFGDLSMAATMGSRRDITLRTSTERFFEYDQMAIQGTERFDINVHDLGSTSEAGPIVALKTPGS